MESVNIDVVSGQHCVMDGQHLDAWATFGCLVNMLRGMEVSDRSRIDQGNVLACNRRQKGGGTRGSLRHTSKPAGSFPVSHIGIRYMAIPVCRYSGSMPTICAELRFAVEAVKQRLFRISAL